MSEIAFRDRIPAPPQGWQKLKWYGPGLLWMLSAVGTGSILFTPRVASVYTYELLWLLLLVVFFMWVMIREMARYSIVTGETILEGVNKLPGPKGWAVWVIFVPQLIAAAIGIAGLSAVVGSALAEFSPGSSTLYGIAVALACTTFTVTGSYMRIERFSRLMALALMLMAVISAVVVSPEVKQIGTGLQFHWPDEANLYVILPWVGTILAGSMGIVWFGYWTATRGYGGGLRGQEPDDEVPESVRAEQGASEMDSDHTEARIERAKEWIRIMSGAATLGVLGGLIVIFAFLVLGSELLAPKGILPEGTDVAVDLARLFTDIWGQAGKYLLLAAIIIAIGGSVLANQDGWGRSFADMTLILTRKRRRSANKGWILNFLQRMVDKSKHPMSERRYLKRVYIAVVTGVIPVAILLVFKDPVKVMSASGIIAAAHTPFIVITALLVNRTQLPKALRPSTFVTWMMAFAGIFYLGFAALYIQSM